MCQIISEVLDWVHSPEEDGGARHDDKTYPGFAAVEVPALNRDRLHGEDCESTFLLA